MPKKNTGKTKQKIVSSAWKLFYEQGYDATTIEDIVYESSTSKGSFYHYFNSKDDLLGTLSDLFDGKYEELEGQIQPESNRFEVLMWLNRELFRMIEDTVSLELLARMYSAQLTTKLEKRLLDHTRTYFKLLRKMIIEGVERGEISDSDPVNDIVKTYAMCERAFMYDWCICNGEYSLSDYSAKMLPRLMASYKK